MFGSKALSKRNEKRALRRGRAGKPLILFSVLFILGFAILFAGASVANASYADFTAVKRSDVLPQLFIVLGLFAGGATVVAGIWQKTFPSANRLKRERREDW